MAFFNLLHTAPVSLGLDISDRSLKAVQIRRKRRGLTLVSWCNTALPPGIVERGLVQDPEKLALAIREALKNIEGEKIATRHVAFSLPEEQAFVRVAQLPELSERELPEAMRWEAEANIPLSIKDVYFDWQVIQRVEERGKRHLDVLFAAVEKKAIDAYLVALKQAELSAVALEVEPIPLARAVLQARLRYSPTILMDFGATRTGLALYSGSSVLLTTTIPFAGSKLTDELRAALHLSFEQAEERKRLHGIGEGKEGSENLKILRPALSELIAKVNDYITFYQTHPLHEHGVYTLAVARPEERTGSFDFKPVPRSEVLVSRTPSGSSGITKIVLCGGEANLPGLSEFLSSNLGLPVERGDPLVNVKGKLSGTLPARELLPLAHAIGLALRRFL